MDRRDAHGQGALVRARDHSRSSASAPAGSSPPAPSARRPRAPRASADGGARARARRAGSRAASAARGSRRRGSGARARTPPRCGRASRSAARRASRSHRRSRHGQALVVSVARRWPRPCGSSPRPGGARQRQARIRPRRQEQRGRPTEKELDEEAVERLLARLERCRDDRDPAPGASETGRASTRQRPSPKPGSDVGSKCSGPRVHGVNWPGQKRAGPDIRRRPGHLAGRRASWATPSAPPKSRPSPVAARWVSALTSSARTSRSRFTELVSELAHPLVHERAEREQDDRHHAGEHDGEADPDRRAWLSIRRPRAGGSRRLAPSRSRRCPNGRSIFSRR